MDHHKAWGCDCDFSIMNAIKSQLSNGVILCFRRFEKNLMHQYIQVLQLSERDCNRIILLFMDDKQKKGLLDSETMQEFEQNWAIAMESIQNIANKETEKKGDILINYLSNHKFDKMAKYMINENRKSLGLKDRYYHDSIVDSKHNQLQ